MIDREKLIKLAYSKILFYDCDCEIVKASKLRPIYHRLLDLF